MPTHLADDIHLVSEAEGNRRSLRSSSDNVCKHVYAQQLWRQKLWRCRSANLEQSAMWPRTLEVSYKHFKMLLKTNTVSGKNGPPKHVKITLRIANDSHYFSLCDEKPSICNVYVKFHDN